MFVYEPQHHCYSISDFLNLGQCGDGILQYKYEVCDGVEVGDDTCDSHWFAWGGGVLSCNDTCSGDGGGNGELLKGSGNTCLNPQGQHYFVDIEPAKGNIERSATGSTTRVAHDCTQAQCNQSNYGTAGTFPSLPI